MKQRIGSSVTLVPRVATARFCSLDYGHGCSVTLRIFATFLGDRKNFSEVSNFAVGLPDGVRRNKLHETPLLLFVKASSATLFLLIARKAFFASKEEKQAINRSFVDRQNADKEALL